MRKLLLSTLSAVLLGQASFGLASEIAHTSMLVNLSAPKNIMLIVHTSSTTGDTLKPHTFTGCMSDNTVFMLGKGFPEGTLSSTYFIENSSGSFEAIKSYDVFIKGEDMLAQPEKVEIDMSAYSNYPTCATNPSTHSVFELYPSK